MKFYFMSFMFLFFFGLMFFISGLFLLYNDFFYLIDYDFCLLNSCSFVFTLLLDWMSFLFMSVVVFISSMVVLYSNSYMSMDKYKVRFLFLVLLFIMSMLLMILSPNLISILLGWDGLGLVSYCLVIYFQNLKSYNAGMLTILSNRVGDAAIILGISLLFNSGDFNFGYLNYYLFDYSFYLFVLVVLAAFTKSAQIPFSSWLPAAMAAPTPVSALVHSSTLVTAGVYLLIRFSPLLSNYDLSFVLFISMMTMFMSGLGANFEYDLKKIIALSTLSQLGLMMCFLFLGFPLVSFFHLLCHAFFKALLFLCAGLIIHCFNDNQDIRFMGGVSNMIPYTSSCFCVANLSLCGLPFLSGFYSKDLGLEMFSFSTSNLLLYCVFYLSLGLTVSYTFRLLYYVMYGYNQFSVSCNFYECFTMMFSMIFMSFMGVMGGSLMSWLMFPSPEFLFLPLESKLLSLFFIFLGGMMSYSLSYVNFSYISYCMMMNFTSSFLGTMWFMPNFSTYMIYSKSMLLSFSYYDFMDLGWGEYLISKACPTYLVVLSKMNLKLQFNHFKSMLFSFVIIMFFMIIV
uniref:NADH-ubiquinone oxidoreductase chain 5 n=1 Tax=Stenophyella macreta TaxID=2813424 RepID=A0A8T9ZWW1_9HEMI|nr:NADH dehydrogenase subunit 5 [Stenophyella macreta]